MRVSGEQALADRRSGGEEGEKRKRGRTVVLLSASPCRRGGKKRKGEKSRMRERSLFVMSGTVVGCKEEGEEKDEQLLSRSREKRKGKDPGSLPFFPRQKGEGERKEEGGRPPACSQKERKKKKRKEREQSVCRHILPLFDKRKERKGGTPVYELRLFFDRTKKKKRGGD